MADTHEGSFRNLVGRPSSLLMGMKKKIYPEIGNDAIWTVRFDSKVDGQKVAVMTHEPNQKVIFIFSC